MAGSKGAKHSKNKVKSKSNKPDAINQEPVQIPKRNPDGPNDSKDENPQPNMNSSMTTSWSKYTEKEMEQFLLVKLERSYLRAKGWLLKSGYGLAEIDRAILNAGYINSLMDIENNLLKNLLSFIEGKFEPKREALKDMDHLYNTVLATMVFGVMLVRPNLQRSDALWLLLQSNWGSLPPTVGTSQPGSSSKNENAEKIQYKSKMRILKRVSLKPALVSRLRHNIPIIAAALKSEIGAPVTNKNAITNPVGFFTSIEGNSFMTFLREWLESESDDESTTPELVDLVKTISELYEAVKERKQWAQKKVMDAAKRVSEDLGELKMLKMNAEQLKSDKMLAEKNETLLKLKIMQIANCLRYADCQVNHMTDAVRRLESENAEIRASIEAFNLNASESDSELKVVMQREMKCKKKLAEIERQKSVFQQQREVEKQRVLHLEQELLQAEKEAEDAEVTWSQAVMEKEQMFALLAEENKMADTQKANSRAEISRLRQKVDIDSQLALDDCRRLEDELSSLRLAHQMSDLSLEDDILLYRSLEGTSSESNAPNEKISHWNCMICTDAEVNVVFLPCTHQVVCFSCYEGRCKMKGQCPYCGAQIEQSIRVYGPSS